MCLHIQYINIAFLVFALANCFITSLWSMVLALSPSMLRTDNPLTRVCPIDDRINVLISLSLLNDLSADADVTGSVRNNFKSTQTFGKDDTISVFSMNRSSASSRIVWIFSSSLYNDVFNRTSSTIREDEISEGYSLRMSLHFTLRSSSLSFNKYCGDRISNTTTISFMPSEAHVF